MTNEVPPQGSNDANKNKEHENVCPLSFKLKETYFSIETIYNEWFGLGTYTIIVPGGIYLLETLHSQCNKNNNSAFNDKLSCLQFIATTVATLDYSERNPDSNVLDDL